MTTLQKMSDVEMSLYNCDLFPDESLQVPADHCIFAYLTFANLPETAKLRDVFLRTAKTFGRMHSVADSSGNWIPQESLDAEYHIVEERVNDLSLRKNALFRDEFDLNKPLWRCHILVATNRNDHCVVFRIHHCIGDGFRLAKFFEALSETETGEPSNFLAQAKKTFTANASKSFFNKLLMSLDVFRSLFQIMTTCFQSYESEFIGHTSLKHRKAKMPFQERRLVDLPILSLSEVKAIKNAFKGTVNDALFTWMAGSYRRYASAKRDPQFVEMDSKLTARSLVPVAFPLNPKWETGIDVLCNRFCFVSVDIPIKYSSCDDRLMAVRKSFDSLKTTTFPRMSLFAADLVAKLPTKIRQGAASDLFSTHTNVFSNVPGPPDAVYVCGEKLVSVSAAYSNLITQFLLVSYDDKVFGTIVVDPNVLEPELIVKMFADEWESMKSQFLGGTSSHASNTAESYVKQT